MKIFILSQIVISLFLTELSGQGGFRHKRNSKTANIEQFSMTLTPRAGEDNTHIRLDVYVMIPGFALQFIKEKGVFTSSFQARISLLDKEGNQLDSKIVEKTLTAEDYLETVSRTNWFFIEHEFLVDAQEYTVISEVMDLDTRNSGVRKMKIDLKKYDTDLKLFPPVILTNLEGTWQGGKKSVPSHKNQISYQQLFIPINVSGKVKEENYSIHIKLSDESGGILSILDSNFTVNLNYFDITLNLPIEEIHGLRAELIVELRQKGKIDSESIELKIKRPGVSSAVRNVDEALDQMRYILKPKERSTLSKSKKKDKEMLFYSFWQDRDPTPETNENELMNQYYNRVNYTVEHFTSFMPGWKTDMGMIFILFGAPDDIERSFMSSNRNARQRWHYYRINRSFTFYDENGFGDFRLTTPYLSGSAW